MIAETGGKATAAAAMPTSFSKNDNCEPGLHHKPEKLINDD